MTTSLSDFSNALATYFDEKRKEDHAIVTRMKEELPTLIRNITGFDCGELLDEYDSCLNGHYSDPRRLAVASEYKEALRKTILDRMINS